MRISSIFLLCLLTCCSSEPNIKAIRNKIARITKPDGRPSGSGSLVSTPSGKKVILTNAHVCHDNSRQTLYLADDSSSYLLSSVVKIDSDADLCAIGLPDLFLPFERGLKLGKHPKKLDRTFVLGYPLDYPLNPNFGNFLGDAQVELMVPIPLEIFLDVTKTPKELCPKGEIKFEFVFPVCAFKINVMQLNNVIYPGNSGSPVLNMDSELIGVVQVGNSNTNYGGAIPTEVIQEFLKGL